MSASGQRSSPSEQHHSRYAPWEAEVQLTSAWSSALEQISARQQSTVSISRICSRMTPT